MEQQTGRTREAKCRGFLLYYGDMELMLEILNATQFRNVMSAVMTYMKTGEEPAFSGKENSVFKVLKDKADLQRETYIKTCDRNRKIAQNRKRQSPQEQEKPDRKAEETIGDDSLPSVTTRDDSLPLVTTRDDWSPLVTTRDDWSPLVTTGDQIKENKIKQNKIKQNKTEIKETASFQSGVGHPYPVSYETAFAANPTPEQEKLFTAFRGEYPKKNGMYRALPVFLGAVEEVGFEELMAALKRQKNAPDWKKEHGRFVPAADKWLAERCWEDFPETPQRDKYALPSMY